MKFVGCLISLVALGAGCASNAGAPPRASSSVVKNSVPRPVLMRSAEVDTLIRAAWTAKGVTPTAKVDDAGFFRRVHLDLAGRVPRAEAVEAFLEDRAPDKREKAIEALLDAPTYADHFTNYWDRVLLGRDVRNNVDRAAFRQWLHQRLETNTPYDAWVRDLIAATGLTTGNGATNWYVRYMDSPPDLAGATSRLFLGVQIQCAQCHDHKTEKWTMADFQGFTASFLQTRAQRVGDMDAKKDRAFDVEDIAAPRRGKRVAEYRGATPRALDGTVLSTDGKPRAALASWITAKENRWFARAMVNRLWAKMLGRGFFEPIDDARESNPPVMGALLDALAKDFVASGYDAKHLLRLIANTEVYQLGARAKVHGATWGASGVREEDRAGARARAGEEERALWAYFHMARLGPDELLDSLVEATGFPSEKREQVRAGLRKQFAYLFDVDEEADHQDEFDGTIAQALWMMNGQVLGKGTQGAALASALAMPGKDESKIRALYMRTLSRPPTEEETAHWVTFVSTNAMRPAYEDLFWALLNSSEFVFNH